MGYNFCFYLNLKQEQVLTQIMISCSFIVASNEKKVIQINDDTMNQLRNSDKIEIIKCSFHVIKNEQNRASRKHRC